MIPPSASPIANSGGVPRRPACAVTVPRTTMRLPIGAVLAAAGSRTTDPGVGVGVGRGVGVGVGRGVDVGVGEAEGAGVGVAVGGGVGVGLGIGVGVGSGVTISSSPANVAWTR